MLKNKINYNEEHLTVKEALNLGIVAIFAQRETAREVTRQVIELYLKIEVIPKKLEYTLYSVLYAMIDAYFADEKEYEELINMINNETADEVIDRFETEIISQNKIIELEKELNEVIIRADSEAIRADNAEAENLRLKNEIKMLKNRLNSINL